MNVGLTIQYIVRDRTVFQQCILENRGEIDVDLQFAFCKAMRICDLDHVTDHYEFNETTSDDQNAGPGPGGFGWVHVNEFRKESPGARTNFQHSSHTTKSSSSRSSHNEKDQPNHGVALVVSMAVGGEMIRFSPGQSPHIWKQTLKAKSNTSEPTSRKLEIVTAYKLVLLTDPLSDWKTFVVPLKEMNLSRLLGEATEVSSFRISMPRICGNDDLSHSYDRRHSETLADEENKGEAGMVNVSQDEDATVESEPQTEPSPAIHHEPTPERTSPIMEHIEFSTRRNLAHILDVCAIPVAILKAMEFANTFNDGEDDDSSLVGEIISQWGRGWLRWLERSDRRGSLTWYHKEDEGLKVFRLDDHVWIWRALKAMEDKRLGGWAILPDRAQRSDSASSADSEASEADEISRLRRKFASRTVQREVLRKFTTQHETLRKRMVALSRSPRETRFLFHARDTALFYDQDMEFSPEDASFQEAWKNTIDAQRFHEDNQETRWGNALRYALSIMLAIKDHQINSRNPGDMVRNAIEILLRSSSENGTFPGKLDIMTKGPLDDVYHTEEDAESYYNAGFEIPYVFLVHGKAIGAIIDKAAEPELGTASGDVHQLEDEELRRLLEKLSDVLSARPYLPNPTSASDRTKSRELVDARLALKKTIPVSNLVDPHSIAEIEDEWLFNYPNFFGSEKDDSISIDETLDSLQDLNAAWLTRIDVAEMRRKYSSHKTEGGGPDNQTKSSSNDSDSITKKRSASREGTRNSGLMVSDMPSRKHLRGKGAEDPYGEQTGSFEKIWGHISKPRTAAKAKKRFIYWDRQATDLELEAALLCYAASKGDERANMLDFFERHFQHENYMFDHCNLAYNTWETEIHLSFFILGDASGPPSSDTVRKVEGFPGVHGKNISRGSVGFRFHGDAFDRYWTLHTFASLDLESKSFKEDAISRFLPTEISFVFQRKVFELYTFSGTLKKVELSTSQILAEVKSELGIEFGAFSWSIPTMDTYSSWTKLWEGFAPLLQALADDLTSTQDTIGQWEAREGARGQERPRWTQNDERKYRVAITRAQRVLQFREKRIQDLLGDVESLREACAARLANAREELSFRSNQNIASFTYVTIVFLPLGFAASVFSMNGYPAAGWVASMAVIAVITLAITATALANAKLFLAVAEQFSKSTLRLTEAVFEASRSASETSERGTHRCRINPHMLFLYNALDILTFFARLTRNTLYSLAAPSDPDRAATDTKMVKWLIKPPQSLRPVRKYMSRDEKDNKSTSQADTPVAADKSDSGPLEPA
ncbi:hypothetical protein SLS63_009165 [Diaporthe eres]|uniref:Uncharacterized protein n=1 Tax=Diaporthe eres TaxID=83184 RepID=A0ABR1P0K1_DIAER